MGELRASGRTGQLTFSMELVWREACIHAQAQVRAYSHFKVRMLIVAYCPCCIILQIFSPLEVKNKPLKEATKHAFILRPVSTVVNNYDSTLKKLPIILGNGGNFYH